MSQALKLHEKLKSQVKTERKITHEILITLQEFDITQCYRELGYSSLYDHLVRGHGYSEGAANRRIQASRLLKQMPQIESNIEEGKLNLTQLALAQSAIRQVEKKSGVKISKEQKQVALQALQGKNHFETQKVLVETFPQFEPASHKPVPTKNKKVQVTLEFSEKDWEKMQALLAHMSHKLPDQKIESALLYWAAQIEKKKQIREQALSPAKLVDEKENAEIAPETENKNLHPDSVDIKTSNPFHKSPPAAVKYSCLYFCKNQASCIPESSTSM